MRHLNRQRLKEIKRQGRRHINGDIKRTDRHKERVSKKLRQGQEKKEIYSDKQKGKRTRKNNKKQKQKQKQKPREGKEGERTNVKIKRYTEKQRRRNESGKKLFENKSYIHQEDVVNLS